MVENFRNFKYSKICLSNKNVVFGMNDVGKTNLLSSLRYLLERKVRINGFSESDFYQRELDNDIKITLEIDLSDYEDNLDSQHIVAKVGGARTSSELNLFYFQVIGKYDAAEAMGIPELFWGNDLEKLESVPQNGSFTILDKLFNVVYVDQTIDLDTVFSKNRRKLFEQKKMIDSDIEIKEDIDKLTNQVNSKISSMDVIQSFQSELTDEYQQLKKEKITIELQSEMAIKGFFSDIHPYIKKEGDDSLYPTSGDGRKKILAYSLLNYLNKEYDSDRITLYLIEEPENSLHRSMQIALSKQLFTNSVYDYFVLSTHSSELLYEMDNASLVRIYSEDRTLCESFLFKVPSEFSSIKKELNESLTKALFSDRVLLIEGPSEKALFEKVLSVIKPTYELDGGYILLVDGIKFKPYFDILKSLNIIPIVKTDNDLKAKKGNKTLFDPIGFNRCCKLINQENLDEIEIDYSCTDKDGKSTWLVQRKNKLVFEKKKELYNQYKEVLSNFEKNNIFLSRVDLENDLYEVIPDQLKKVFGEIDPVKSLQDKKLLNMLKLIDDLTNLNCLKIFNHDRFKALKKLVGD